MWLSAGEIARTVDGSLLAGPPSVVVTSYAIDSRLIAPGGCFVALRARRDGHDFVPDAWARGARATLVRRPVDAPGGAAVIAVGDPLRALGRLGARARAEQLAETLVVAVTGSAGKTVTKDLAAAAFAPARRVHASPGSFNNEAGVPLTLLHAADDVEVLVTEMGARFPGDIAQLCAIARPDVGIVTNIGMAHAGQLGGREGVARTKGELVEALPASGLAVLNGDDEMASRLAGRSRAAVLRVGSGASADVRVGPVHLDAELRPSFVLDSPWGKAHLALEVRGAHQALNAGLAAATALWAGVPIDAVADGLASARSAEGRMELWLAPEGISVLNDAYNASPDSAAAALRALAHLDVRGRRIAVLGEMLELGAHAEEEHARLGALAGALGIDLVIAVGPGALPLTAPARASGVEVVTVTGVQEAVEAVRAHARSGDAVLVKASRAIGLERVAHALHRGAGVS